MVQMAQGRCQSHEDQMEHRCRKSLLLEALHPMIHDVAGGQRSREGSRMRSHRDLPLVA